MRYFIEFAYKGTNYHGWQVQPNAITVQEELTKALNLLLSTKTEIVAAGRTDAGVHAQKMFAHFDTYQKIDEIKLKSKLNSFLPKDIAIRHIFPVKDDAHARFDATRRKYNYYLHTHKNPFLNETSWYQYRPLDFEKMNQAAQILFEYEDFECFSKAHTDVYTYICQIFEAQWINIAENQWVFSIEANRFLRNMVRAIVGTLINIGLGKIEPEGLHQIIQSKDRGKAGFSVPAQGLHLVNVSYPYL